MNRYNDKFWTWAAARMPRALVYFCTIRLWAHATSGEFGDTNAATITVDEALRRWNKQLLHENKDPKEEN